MGWVVRGPTRVLRSAVAVDSEPGGGVSVTGRNMRLTVAMLSEAVGELRMLVRDLRLAMEVCSGVIDVTTAGAEVVGESFIVVVL